MILFRQCDPRFPFLWDNDRQPPARWHAAGEGPVHYLSDTPDGAWAEFLRHEEIRLAEDLKGIRMTMWAIEVDAPPTARPSLMNAVVCGEAATYPRCRREAARLRKKGLAGFRVRAAAILPGQARGWRVKNGLSPAASRDGLVFVLFGPRSDLTGWMAAVDGRPPEYLLSRVRHL